MKQDLAHLKRLAESGDGNEEIPITRRCLAQIVAELTEGREASARLGCVALHGKPL